jgi:pantoate--beta-alanine ligase
VKQIHSIDELRAAISAWREVGDTVALVPTMGNLHKGHISLAKLAAEYAEHVVVSVFVNPTQFGPNEDFDAYPRTLAADARKLSHAGMDIMFAPSVKEIYPRGLDNGTQVLVPGLSDQLCGAARPGHFAGVTSVVCRLLNICAPDVAVFGQKDYQQWIILRKMVADLHSPVRLVAGPTMREKSGLAMSSRNSLLDDAQRDKAASIFSALIGVEQQLQAGRRDYAKLEDEAAGHIRDAGLETEYVAIRRSLDLGMPEKDTPRLSVLAAARLGKVRLIDNVLVELSQ